MLNVVFYPRSRYFELLVRFDSALVMILHISEDGFETGKIRCLLDDHAFSYVRFEEEAEGEQGSLLCEIVMKAFQKSSLGPLSISENLEQISMVFQRYAEPLKALRESFCSNQIQSIRMDR